MNCTCGTNWAYALARDGKIRRLTFSRNLAEFIQTRNPDHEVLLLDLVPGRRARRGDQGLFGIMDARKGKLLRATVSWDEAEFLTQDESRYAVLCTVRETRQHVAPLRDCA